MYHKLQNAYLTLEVAETGAEMHSIKDSAGQEYLWQGDADSWPQQAINLFPWVARLWQGQYTYGGKTYCMEPHGFAAASNFSCTRPSPQQMLFTLTESPETLKKYPFRFVFQIGYQLTGKRIDITFRVENKDDKTLYFGMGGHPGFILPMDEGADFSDYSLKFSAPCKPRRVGFSPDCFVTGAHTPFVLQGGDTLPLRQDLFDDDAIVLREMADAVTICGPGDKKITVSYPGFPYLGIWNWPKKDVGYICIEPWTALPGRKGVVEALGEKADLTALEAGDTHQRAWAICL